MKPGRAGSILLPLAAAMGAKELYDRYTERRTTKPAPLPNVEIVPIYEVDTHISERTTTSERIHDTGNTIFSPQEGGIDDFASLAQAVRDSTQEST